MRRTSKALALCTATVATGALAMAGDLERFCNWFPNEQPPPPTIAFEVGESWANPVQVPWVVYTNQANGDVIPTFPACGIPDVRNRPGYAPIARAGRTWSDVGLRQSPCSDFQSAVPIGEFSLIAAPPEVTGPIGAGSTAIAVESPGRNTVSFWESAQFFVNNGAGALTIAIARVFATGANCGEILDADIACQALAPTTGGVVPWSWVDVTAGGTRASYDPGAAGFTTPSLGFADVEGFLAHELGHLAGLGHSVLDSTASAAGSRFPTMFPVAQVEPFLTNVFATASCSSSAKVLADGALTPTGGILGRSARTLEHDDVAAIARGYPTPAFGSSLGTISGQVLLGGGCPYHAASVVAIHQDCPDIARIGTLSYEFGSCFGFPGGNPGPTALYSISGLPPGRYYVYVERIDQDPTGSDAPEFYFNNTTDLPNYANIVFGPPAAPVCGTGCLGPNQLPIDIEFWNNNDVGPGELPNLATQVAVGAGQTVTGVDFQVDGFNDLRLEVRDVPTDAFSHRGVMTSQAQVTNQQVELRLVNGPANADFDIYLSFDRSTSFIDGQLLQVPASPFVGTIPGRITGTLDANGSWQGTLPSPGGTGTLFRNIFAQADVDGGASSILSNATNVWVQN